MLEPDVKNGQSSIPEWWKEPHVGIKALITILSKASGIRVVIGWAMIPVAKQTRLNDLLAHYDVGDLPTS